MIEQRLLAQPYLAGPAFAAADIMMGFVLTTMRAFTGRSLAGFPGIRAYLARIGERPAYPRAMAKGDPGFTPPLSREGMNQPAVTARTARRRPLRVANARRSASYGCALRLDCAPPDGPLGHAGFIHTF